MVQILFVIYLVVTLIIASLTSVYAKGIEGIEMVTYFNNILIILSTALLSANVTFLYVKGHPSESNIPKYLFLVFILISIAMSSIMISSKEYTLCSSEMKSTIVFNLIMNIVLMFCAIIFMYQSKKNQEKERGLDWESVRVD